MSLRNRGRSTLTFHMGKACNGLIHERCGSHKSRSVIQSKGSCEHSSMALIFQKQQFCWCNLILTPSPPLHECGPPDWALWGAPSEDLWIRSNRNKSNRLYIYIDNTACRSLKKTILFWRCPISRNHHFLPTRTFSRCQWFSDSKLLHCQYSKYAWYCLVRYREKWAVSLLQSTNKKWLRLHLGSSFLDFL